MRILHVTPTYLPATRYGGPIYSVHGLCAALALRGHHVEVFTTNVDGGDVSNVPVGRPVTMDGVEVTYFPTGVGRRLYRSPMMTKFLSRRLPEFDLAHIHSVFLWPTITGAAVSRRSGVPYILSPRGMLVHELIARKSRLVKQSWIYLFERRNVREAAALHVTSSLEAEQIMRLGLSPRRVDVIPNGFDLPLDASSAIADAAPRSGGPVVLSLGRINWKKGLDRLITSMARVQGAELIIAGNDDDGYTEQLNALAKSQGVAGRTHIVGPVHGRTKWDLFARADVFALASHSENFGIAVLEAMACGIPVVVTPEVGLAGAIGDAGAGLVIDSDPETFGAAIAQLIATPELRRQMGERGRRLALSYSWSAVAERMEKTYAEIIASSSKTERDLV